MSHSFDKDYWEQQWQNPPDGAQAAMALLPPNPHLVQQIGTLQPGTALDAGCGAGAEAIWLAAQGWQVTGVDIAEQALTRAAERAAAADITDGVHWVRADLSVWEPAMTYDLVTTHYAHPTMPQLDFYDRIAQWVAPGGTLLIVGHLHHGHSHDGDQPPASATVTAAVITARFEPSRWEIIAAEESARTVTGNNHSTVELHDVVVRFARRR